MIELKTNESLYYICNEGCDDTTEGLAIISDEDFPKFKKIIEELNMNSTYECMPTIAVYKIDESMIREYTDDMYGDPMYLNGKRYKDLDESMKRLWQIGEKVI